MKISNDRDAYLDGLLQVAASQSRVLANERAERFSPFVRTRQRGLSALRLLWSGVALAGLLLAGGGTWAVIAKLQVADNRPAPVVSPVDAERIGPMPQQHVKKRAPIVVAVREVRVRPRRALRPKAAVAKPTETHVTADRRVDQLVFPEGFGEVITVHRRPKHGPLWTPGDFAKSVFK